MHDVWPGYRQQAVNVSVYIGHLRQPIMSMPLLYVTASCDGPGLTWLAANG